MPWLPYRLRDADVWARVDERGEPVADSGGRVEVVYKAATGAKVYRASAKNLTRRPGDAVDIEPGEPAPSKEERRKSEATVKDVPADAIAVWTDGACTGNPGPAGVGVVVIDGADRRELSEYLGEATNNIAELTAIERGLELVENRDRTVYVHSDSAYAIGLLSKNWKAKANVELVARIRDLVAEFPAIRWVKVAGHAGVPENERCDQLARMAVQSRSTSPARSTRPLDAPSSRRREG
jgi:ribonuclease HI